MTKEEAIVVVENMVSARRQAMRDGRNLGKSDYRGLVDEVYREAEAIEIILYLVKNPPAPFREWGTQGP